MPFEFDQGLSSEENIEAFFVNLENTNPQLTSILKKNLKFVSPFPSEDKDRRGATSKFNESVLREIDPPEIKHD